MPPPALGRAASTRSSTPVSATPVGQLGAYLASDRRRAVAEGRSLPDRAHGAAVFADISGFTPLTEALARELGPQHGAEELTVHLDRIFHEVIGDIHRHDGDVIYFAGDAIICWFDGDDGTRAVASGLAVQRTMQEVGRVRTPAGGEVVLAIKVAVAVGPVRRFVVGDPTIQQLDVLAGRLVDELADAEHLAGKGDVVLAPSAMRSLGDRVVIVERRASSGGAVVGVVSALSAAFAVPDEPVPEPPLPDELARTWVLPAVYERMVSGQGAFLAELRPAYPMFVRFGVIDYDDDPDSAGKLDRFVSRVQAILHSNGGNLLQIVLGDKGAYFYAIFGSPNAHEDDAERAAAAAIAILATTADTAITQLQIGIAHGRLRSGTCGHAMRRTFTCLGDAVNLAARLMSRAQVGEVLLTDDVRRAAPERLPCDDVGVVAVKGRSDPVTVLRLRAGAARPTRRALRYPLPIVGREAELDAITEACTAVVAGTGRVVGIAAEAGRGKSRLVAEAVRRLRGDGIPVVYGEAQSFGVASSYAIWREVWRTLLELDDDAPDDVQRRRLARVLGALGRSHLERAPLLEPVIGIELPDSELTGSFNAKLRKASLEALLADLLRDRATRGPVAIVLEDCQWIDPLSRDLLDEFVRAAVRLPVLFLLAYRPADAPGGGLGVEHHPHFRELVLDELNQEAADLVARAKLRQVFGQAVDPAPELVVLLTGRAQGNPFYLEELVNYLQVQGHDPSDASVVARLELPDSLHRLVLGRLDVLAAASRSALSVASVVGRAFDTSVVRGTYPELGSADDVDRLLAPAQAADLIAADRVDDRSWLFRHAVTHEVVYESLPFAMRTSLHMRVGGFLETGGADAVERDLDLLAAHYWLGDDDAKKREYLVRAGVAAQSRYANEAAVTYFRRALPLLTGHERTPVLRRLGKVLELQGSWTDAERTYLDAVDESARLDDRAGEAWARTDLAEVARKQGRFEDARRQLSVAGDQLRALDDAAGLGLVLHLEGTLASQQGRYTDARAAYEASLAIREHLGDRGSVGALLSNLAVVAESEGDFDLARQLNERALTVRESVGDRWAISVSLNNLGMIAQLQHDFVAAHEFFERSMQLAADVGDRWIVAVGHHNLANAFRGLGRFDVAAAEFVAALAAYEDYADRWSLALLVEDVALLAAAVGRNEAAVELVAAADRVRAELDAPRPPAAAELLAAALGSAHTALGAAQTAVSETRGRERDEAALGALVRSFAEP